MLRGVDRSQADPAGRVEVRPSLSVSQNGDRSEVLLDIQRYFDCGTLRPDRSDRTLKWEIRSLPLIVDRILSSLPAISAAFREAPGFRALREHLRADGSKRTPACTRTA
jgi:hypothetical protein